MVTRTVLPIEGQPRGLLFPANDRGLTREDLAAIPEDATLALAVRLNVQKTLDALAAAGKKADPEIKRSLLKGLETLQRGGDADSRQDVFASLGDHWCFYNSPREGGLVVTGLTGVVPITDRKQFSRSYEVLTRAGHADLARRRHPVPTGNGSAAFVLRAATSITQNLGKSAWPRHGGRATINWSSRWPRRTSRPICRGRKAAGLWPTCRRWPPSFRAAIPCWRSAISMPRGSSNRSIRCS